MVGTWDAIVEKRGHKIALEGLRAREKTRGFFPSPPPPHHPTVIKRQQSMCILAAHTYFMYNICWAERKNNYMLYYQAKKKTKRQKESNPDLCYLFLHTSPHIYSKCRIFNSDMYTSNAINGRYCGGVNYLLISMWDRGPNCLITLLVSSRGP